MQDGFLTDSIVYTNECDCERGIGNPDLEGNLDTLSIIECIQLLIHSGKTGLLDLTTDDTSVVKKCSIYFFRGTIVHACTENTEGLLAFYRALHLKIGVFRFYQGHCNVKQTIFDNPTYLLIEGCRIMDETLAGM